MKFQKKMLKEIILASKSLVRKKILEENGITCVVVPPNVDEDLIKNSILKEGASPNIISKNLAAIIYCVFKYNKPYEPSRVFIPRKR